MILKICATVSLLLSLNLNAQKTSLFKSAPPAAPALFGEGIISDELGNRDMAISPSGDELMYTLQYKSGTFSAILFCQNNKGIWSAPQVVSFSGQYNDLEPAYAPDGSKIYFVSNRPLQPGGKTKDYDIWVVEKKSNKTWGQPQVLPSPVNTVQNEFYPSVTSSGNIYFTREMPGQDEDIVVCTWKNGNYDEAISLPASINTAKAEFNAFVDAEEKLILYTAYRREGNSGSGDIYISFKNADDQWEPSSNLGTVVNDLGLTYCPYISPDKKYFFFTSSRWASPPFKKQQSIIELKTLFKSPSNGWDNIYWMDAESILVKK